MRLGIITLIIGILIFILGIALLKSKTNKISTWINPNKYDCEKVLTIINNHIILLGVALIGLSSIRYVLINMYKELFIGMILLIILGTILSSYLQIYKYAKK